MKKLLLLSFILIGCTKEESGNCAKCYLRTGQLWSYVCEEDLTNQTIEEYIDYWNNAPDLNRSKSN